MIGGLGVPKPILAGPFSGAIGLVWKEHAKGAFLVAGQLHLGPLGRPYSACPKARWPPIFATSDQTGRHPSCRLFKLLVYNELRMQQPRQSEFGNFHRLTAP